MNILKREILVFEVRVDTFKFFQGLEIASGPKGLVINAARLYDHTEERMSKCGERPNQVDAEVLEIYLALTQWDKPDNFVIVSYLPVDKKE